MTSLTLSPVKGRKRPKNGNVMPKITVFELFKITVYLYTNMIFMRKNIFFHMGKNLGPTDVSNLDMTKSQIWSPDMPKYYIFAFRTILHFSAILKKGVYIFLLQQKL